MPIFRAPTETSNETIETLFTAVIKKRGGRFSYSVEVKAIKDAANEELKAIKKIAKNFFNI